MLNFTKAFILVVFVIESLELSNAVSRLAQIPEIVIANGKLTGIFKKSRAGKTFAQFTKIPYAKPPIGALRFKAPIAADAWSNTLDATEEVPKCIQKDYVSFTKPEVEGTEDCLYINVYSPNRAIGTGTKPKNLLPVMVFIHWGANIAGTSKPEIIGPQYFMDRQVVLVTFNYRLGIFGYFSTLNDDAPGNWAAKDQLLALQWVQENIESFGGNKSQVTIFGQSAGAGAVHHLILSESAKGLFHNAISQSGAALCLWAKPQNILQETIYRATAQVVGCDPTDTRKLLECMRNLDAEVLVSASDHFKAFFRDPLIFYTYVIETKSEKNPHPFLEREPIEIIRSGDFNKVPWIIGSTQAEGALKTAPLLIDAAIREDFLPRFDELKTNSFAIEWSVPNETVSPFWEKMKHFYMDADVVDITEPSTITGFTNMIGDRAFYYGMYQTALYHSMQGHGPIWFYNFNYRGSVSYAEDVFSRDSDDKLDFDFGVSHCDDLLYLFSSPELFPEYQMNSTEVQMSKVMIALWTNFAQTGIPHKKWHPLPDISGRNATNKDLHYLDIRGPRHLVLRNDYRRSFMKFWTSSPALENIEGIE